MPDGYERPEILEALEARNFTALREFFKFAEPPEIAGTIEELEEEDRAVVFRLLPRNQASDTFEYLEPEVQASLIHALGRDRVASILNNMSPDDRTSLLEELPAEVTRQVLQMLSPEERRTAVTLMGYPEDSIGRLMTPEYIAVHEDWPIGKAMAHIREHGEDSETLNVIYVTDRRGKLLDDLRIRELILADPEARIGDVTDGHFVALKAWDDQEVAVPAFEEYDRVALPVTDSMGVLLGIVTVDDVLDVALEEATEDIQKIGGTEALDEPYIEAGFLERIRKRAGWLIALFLGQMLTINALGYYVEEIHQAIVLTLFLPLIISSGGNTGSQAATLIVRSLALSEVNLKDWWRVMRREVLSGLVLGGIIGGLGFLRIVIGALLGEPFGPHWPLLALTITVALVGVVLWGTLVGSMLPFVMQRLGADPAASSTPFVTTVVDVTGLMLYLWLSMLILRGTLL
jgi:magnesium transporter